MAQQDDQKSKPVDDKCTKKRLTTSERLQLVLDTQGRRARAYKSLDQSFRSLLQESIDDAKYVEIAEGLMGEFQSVSSEMKQIAAYFDEKNLQKMSRKINKLQELEKEKMTVAMDMQQQILAARPDEHKCSGHGHGHGHGNDEFIWRPRLYQEKQQHASLIEQINDVLAEIKEVRDTLTMRQKIVIKGTSIQIQTRDDFMTTQVNTTQK